MPLIQCPDCLADMSTTARKCQRCGSTTYQQNLIRKNMLPVFFIVLFIGLLILSMAYYAVP